MRENKFRAWDEELGRMYDGEEMEAREDLKAWLSYGRLCIYRIEFSEYVELKELQYTGLKDLNGVEIYEGDILVIGDNKIYVVYDERNALFGFLNVDWVVTQGKIRPLAGNNEHYEVFANIYENPELLEGNK